MTFPPTQSALSRFAIEQTTDLKLNVNIGKKADSIGL